MFRNISCGAMEEADRLRSPHMVSREALHRDFPEHLATCGLLGVDNMAHDMVRAGEYPPLSSVIPGFQQIGASAMHWLLTESGPDLPAHTAQLLRRFSQHLGRSPGDYIHALRLDLARELLRSSRLSIAEISVRCGFAKQDVLSRAIRAENGMTPRQYRNQNAARS